MRVKRWLSKENRQKPSVTIYRRLIALFFVTLIPFFMLSLAANQVAETRLREQSEARLAAQLERMADDYEGLHRRVYSWMKVNLITGYRPLLGNDKTPLSTYMLGQLVSGLFVDLQHLAQMSDEIADIAVFFPRTGRTISLAQYYTRNITEQERARIAAYIDQPQSFLRMQGAFRIQASLSNRSNAEPLYVIEITLSDQALLHNLNQQGMERYALLSPVDESLSMAGDHELLQSLLATIQDTDTRDGQLVMDDYLFSYRYMITTDCYIVSYIPLTTLLEPVRSFDYFSIATMVMAVLCSALVCVYLSKSINRPFQRLVTLFRQVEKGDMTVTLSESPESQHEFALVFRRFGKMMAQIQELMDHRVGQEKALQQAQFRELQAHIAPHFLYNSFNVLRHCILMGDEETAARMTKLLANYFQYLTYKGDLETISLSEEYQHVLDYLEIQKIRFRDNIRIEITPLPEAYEAVLVPPFVLQPLVENVFKHGLKDTTSGAVIAVTTAVCGSALHIIVRDNGLGMTQEALQRLQNAIRANEILPEHSGLINIQRRLQLYSNGRNEISVDSRPDAYFEARICLSIAEEKES